MRTRPNRTKESVSADSTTESIVRDATELPTTAVMPILAGPITPLPMRLLLPPPSNISTGIQPLPPKPHPEHISTKSMLHTVGWSGESIVPDAHKTYYPSSDTSSEDDHAPRRRPRRAPRASFPDDDIRAWQSFGPPDGWSDSDDTVVDEVPLVIRASRPSSKTITPSSTASGSSLPFSKNPSEHMRQSRQTGLCRLFLQNRCTYGKSCRFVHGFLSEKLAPEVLVSH
jgi:hypothetical protein